MKTREEHRAYYHANRERIIERQRAYRKAHPEKTKAQNLKWQAEHGEEKKAYERAYKAAHRERASQLATQWCKDNPERHAANARAWAKKNPAKAKRSAKNTYAKSAATRTAYRARNKARLAAYEAARYQKDAEALKKKAQDWKKKNPHKTKQHKQKRRAKIYDAPVIDIIKIAQWEMEWRGKEIAMCVYCLGQFHPKQCDTDHVIPLSRPEVGGVHSLENVEISCIRCNRSKHDKLLSEWVPHFTPQPGSLCLNQN